MQLATRQRPHPPPVPPRPSRNVVAEALKRTPRPPPCPTRQAPPPPNIRPWSSEDQETAAGRTVVYESGRQRQTNNHQQVRCSSEPRSSFDKLQRSLASPRCCNDETLAYGNGNNIGGNTVAVVDKLEERDSSTNRAASERSLQQHQQQQHHHQQQQPLMKNRRSISDDNILAHNQPNNCGITNLSTIENDARQGDYKTRAEMEKKVSMPGIGGEYLEISEENNETLLNGCVNEDTTECEQIKKSGIRSEDDGTSQKRSSALTDKAYSVGEVRTEISTTLTTFENTLIVNANNDASKVVGVCNAHEQPISRATAEEIVLANGPSGSETPKLEISTISTRATVVVIEEPERKIAFNDDNENIHHQDWLEAGIRYSSTKITLPGDDISDRNDEFASIDDDRDNCDDCDDQKYDDERPTHTKLDRTRIRERMSMSSLQGLPPLPRSLSGFNLSEGRRESAEPPPPPPTRSSSKTQKNFKSTQPSSLRPSPPGRQLTTLDTQLAILRKEMFGLRQLDLSLLSQLWSLNESIQEFRQLLQEQEDRAPSPSPSSEEGEDNSYGSHPPPPPRRPAPLLHHHRPPRPPRPLRRPASDDSPSSEEYGAV